MCPGCYSSSDENLNLFINFAGYIAKFKRMAQYTIKEVLSKKDLKRFITFVDDLYKGCDLFVPPLHKGQEFALMHSPSLE